MQYVSVLLDISSRELNKPFTYSYTHDCKGVPINVGCTVLVNFGNRLAMGYVCGISHTANPNLNPDKLKPILEVVSTPFFNEIAVEFANYISREYIAPLSNCIRLFLPPGGVGKVSKCESGYEFVPAKQKPIVANWVRLLDAASAFKPAKNAIKQQMIIDACKHGEVKVSELNIELGNVSSSIKALENKGVLQVFQKRNLRINPDSQVFDPKFIASNKPVLTQEQDLALSTINKCQENAKGEVVLVDGVTGSGKTEIYLRAIETCLEKGRDALVLVPEISLTPQTLSRFRARFGDIVASLHSKMSNGERFDQLELIRMGQARIVVGARSAIFAPFPNLGLIVIDEEHETSYKQDSSPRYVTKNLACWLAKRVSGVLVLGSATPSVESLTSAKEDDNWHHVVLKNRANNRQLPKIEILDMANEFHGGHKNMFSRKLTRSLNEAIDKNEKVVLLLNQRGFAKFLLCRDCGYVPKCTACDCSLAYHENSNELKCHHCDYKIELMHECPECKSPYLRQFGAGTQRVQSELSQIINRPGVPIIRMDADTTSKKGAHQALLESFASCTPAVLLGTQMIAKGLDFEDVTVVGIINADTMLHLPDFRSEERTFSLILQVAGRAGRAHLEGKVYVQTYNADNIAIRSASMYDREGFLKEQLMARKELMYPPYSRLVNLLFWGRNESLVAQFASKTYDALNEYLQAHRCGSGQADGLFNDNRDENSWIVYPQTPCVLTRLRGDYRYHILIKIPNDINVSEEIAEVLNGFVGSLKSNADVNFTVDVDPGNIL